MNFFTRSISNKLSLLLVLIFFAVSVSHAQSIGDYSSAANANWASASTWQTYNGTAWVAATTYPGQNAGTYSVTIVAGNTVSIPQTGISTNAMGNLTINGQLTLNGSGTSQTLYSLNTSQIAITPNLSPWASINFLNKCILTLPTDAIIKVQAYGLIGECNNNQEIQIGSNKYAACNGAPGYIFTFAELMAGGGTLNSIITPSSNSICLGESVQLLGSYSGAAVTPPTYSWTSTGPGTLTFSPSSVSQNSTVTPTIAGLYTIMLTVTTNNDGTLYNNTERVTLMVNQKSGNPTSAVAGSDSIMVGKSTTLTLVGGGGGNNETVRWYTSTCGGTLVGSGNPLVVSPTVNTTYYGRYEDATPCSYITICAAVTVRVVPFANIWKGSLDTDFAKAGNWMDNTLPVSGQNILFDNNPINDCVLDGDRIVGNVRNPSVKNLVTSANQLTINGTLNFTNSGKIDARSAGSTITFAGNQLQMLPASTFLDTTIYSMKIQNMSGVQLSGNLVVTNNAQIQNGANLSIPVQQSLKVNGQIDNQAGVNGIQIQSSSSLANGSLIFHNASGSSVQATVEMYTKAARATNYKWQFFGIPLRTMSPSPTFDGSYVRQMFETGTTSAEHWLQLTNASNLTSFTGYEITQLSPKTIYFQGELENNDFNSGKLSYTIGATYPGQHLIGNPYTAAIDIKKINFGSTDAAVIENTVYLYNTGSYADWTSEGSGTGSGTSAGQYIAVPLLNAGISGLPSQIPSMQAFLTRTMSDNALATISIPYSSIGTVVKNTDMQRVKTIKNGSMRIDINGSRFSDRMWIITNPDCTHNFDNGWDGYKFGGSILAPQLYSIEADGDYQVNTVDDMNNTELGFQAGEDSFYILTFTNENLETSYKYLYLIDLHDSTTTDITQSGTTYSFAVSPDSPSKRFKIVTSLEKIKDEKKPKINKTELNIFSNQKIIIVDNPDNETGKLTVYDAVSGRIVLNLTFDANGITTFPTKLPTGLYILKAVTSSVEISLSVLLK